MNTMVQTAPNFGAKLMIFRRFSCKTIHKCCFNRYKTIKKQLCNLVQSCGINDLQCVNIIFISLPKYRWFQEVRQKCGMLSLS